MNTIGRNDSAAPPMLPPATLARTTSPAPTQGSAASAPGNGICSVIKSTLARIIARPSSEAAFLTPGGSRQFRGCASMPPISNSHARIGTR